MSPSGPADPPLVQRALALERGFERSCIREVGLLLYVLAAQRGRARIGELGTGCGVGARGSSQRSRRRFRS